MSTSLIRGFSIVTLALLFFFLGEIVVQANPISESRTIDRAFQYEGLKSKRAIQTFDYGNKNEVFVTQRVDATTILSRCEVSGATCNVKDYVELQNFGHGESLEVVKENGKTFIWIGNTANSEISQKWSTDVSLIEYKVNSSKATGAEVINVKTIKGLEKVAPNVKGKAYRTAVAIADDSNRMAFRVQIGPAAKDTYYAIYKTSEVTKALRNSPKNTLNIQDISHLQLTHFTGVPRPNNSFQGFDITGVGTDNKFLYLFGGAAGETPTIFKYSYTNGGNVKHLKTIKIKGSYVGTLEAEGIKVERDPNNANKETIFIGLKPGLDEAGNQKPFRLYKFLE